jgi:hypothetical protein
MSQPESKEPSKMKKLLNGGNESPDESPLEKLKRTVGTSSQPPKAPPPNGGAPVQVEDPQPSQPQPVIRTRGKAGGSRLTSKEWKFLPAFWTIASIMSVTVNVVLLIIVAILLQNLKTVGQTATGIPDQLLGGLYNNFVKMDAASIQTNIHVEKNIPVQFTLNVSGSTNVTLSQDVRIDGALVTLLGFGEAISNKRANIVLPAGTVLPVYIENLVVPVDQTVPAILDVPVDIPLNTTELHEPFVGLQDVVRPYYCMIKPDALSLVDNSPVCP